MEATIQRHEGEAPRGLPGSVFIHSTNRFLHGSLLVCVVHTQSVSVDLQ